MPDQSVIRPGSTVPAVSVLMSAYNAEAYLVEALNCLLAQSFRNFECIIVDDGSTDGTSKILKTFAARDNRIVLLKNEQRLGIPYALNRGLELCQAPLVARADADDRYHRDRLEHQVRFLRTHADVGVLSCAYNRIDARGKYLGTVYPPTKDYIIRFRLLFTSSFLHSGVMFRTDLVRQVGGYDLRYWTAQDTDLWARLRSRTCMANLPLPLVDYRAHNQSIIWNRGSEGQVLSLSIPQRLLSEYLLHTLNLQETAAIIALLQGGPPVDPNDVPVGLKYLTKVLHVAKKRECSETVRYFRREVGKALFRHSTFQSEYSLPITRLLLKTAGQWNPGFTIVRQGVRFILPPTAQMTLKTLKEQFQERFH